MLLFTFAIVLGILSTSYSTHPDGYRRGHGKVKKFQKKYLEMSYIINENIPHFPDPVKPFKLISIFKGPRFCGRWKWFFVNKIEVLESYGTNIDAPVTFYEKGWKTHEIPFENLHGQAVVIDISKRVAHKSDTTVQVSDLLKWEYKHGRIPDGAYVLMDSGWGKRWPNTTAFYGGVTRDAFRFPSFSPKAAEWLLHNRPKISGIGVDTPSCDSAPEGLKFVKVHVKIARKNKICIEQLANVDKIPEKGAEIFILPNRIEGGSGGLSRIFSVWDEPIRSGYQPAHKFKH